MNGLISGIIRWVAFISTIWIPSTVGLAALWIVAEPAEIHEIYRSAVEEAAAHPAPILFGLLSLTILSNVLHTTAKLFTDIYLARISKPPVVGPRGAKLISLLLSMLPWIGVAIGTRHTAQSSASGIEVKTISILRWTSNLTAAALLVIFIGACVRMRNISPSRGKRIWRVVTLLALGVMITLVAASISSSQLFGPLSIVALFLATLAIMLTLGTEVYRRYEIPLIPMFLCAFVLFSYFDLNDNHRLRTIRPPKQQDAGRLQFDNLSHSWLKSNGSFTSDDIFSAWLANRRDLDAYKKSNKRYPIYVIAAQGGGIYAAYHTAAFLAAMQDRCPTFAQHIFAISAVSGGSLGSAVFAGLVRTQGNNKESEACISAETIPPPVFAQQVDAILQTDFLSPVLSGALFPDFMQQFLPVAFPSIDRARRLEHSIENAWATNSAKEPDVMSRGISHTWTFDGAVPGLIFNSTAVDSGRATLISSFPFPMWKAGPDDISDRICHDEEIPLSTAAVVSARFPWVTPAAWLPDSRCPENGRDKSEKVTKLRLVDGGYYENSGTETAQNVIETLQTTQHVPNAFVVKLIVLSASTSPAAVGTSLPELLSPIRTFLSVREERTRRSQRLASNETCNQMINFEVSEFTSYRNCLDFRSYEFPLGWKISAVTRTLIKNHIGLSGRCWPPDQLDPNIDPGVRFRMANVCTTMQIMRDLNPSDL